MLPGSREQSVLRTFRVVLSFPGTVIRERWWCLRVVAGGCSFLFEQHRFWDFLIEPRFHQLKSGSSSEERAFPVHSDLGIIFQMKRTLLPTEMYRKGQFYRRWQEGTLPQGPQPSACYTQCLCLLVHIVRRLYRDCAWFTYGIITAFSFSVLCRIFLFSAYRFIYITF